MNTIDPLQQARAVLSTDCLQLWLECWRDTPPDECQGMIRAYIDAHLLDRGVALPTEEDIEGRIWEARAADVAELIRTRPELSLLDIFDGTMHQPALPADVTSCFLWAIREARFGVQGRSPSEHPYQHPHEANMISDRWADGHKMVYRANDTTAWYVRPLLSCKGMDRMTNEIHPLAWRVSGYRLYVGGFASASMHQRRARYCRPSLVLRLDDKYSWYTWISLRSDAAREYLAWLCDTWAVYGQCTHRMIIDNALPPELAAPCILGG
jgi:ribosome modulation factor